MEKETTSFWTDIKKFEDMLAKDPHSYCFAPLSELYRKIGLLDDALNVAKRGAAIHPEYIGGHIALGRAYFEKGLNADAKQSLEKVSKATPENLLAQKLLYRIYREEGNVPAAEKALQLLVAFNPEDLESREALDAIRRSSAERESGECIVEEIEADETSSLAADTLPEIEQVQSFDLSDVVAGDVEDPAEAGLPMEPDFFSEEFLESGESDIAEKPVEAVPMSTATLAELYVSQGFYSKALDVYRQLESEDPGNVDLEARISSVCKLMQQSVEVVPQEKAVMENGKADSCGSGFSDEGTCLAEMAIVEELEQWLHSIRRRKECQ
ncbi:MAG: hypothetical protein VB050_05705 [Geobacteraceae bacterium]|nr:hypothetical protein [Geobacteraceae bacterium]